MALTVSVFVADQPFGSDDPDGFVEIARAAEESGFDTIWMGDHPVRPAIDPTTYPYSGTGRPVAHKEDSLFDPIVTLAYIAGATKRIRIGTAVYVLPFRHPLVTARNVTTLDRASKGRVLFGVGTGWLEDEFNALGVSYARRGALMDDALRILRRLWTEDVVSSESATYPFGPVLLRPQPVQRPHPPILVGGQSEVALRRAVTLGDGWIPVAPELDELAVMLGQLDDALAVAGRSRDGFLVDVRAPRVPDLDLLARYEELGVNDVRIHGADLAGRPHRECTVAQVVAAVERYGADVLAKRG